ncbi:MAG: twitching motility protein PilT [Gammaproteobacteria bacterium]|nr:MAG: twitching motility protein PilT [Gammaproteobacteria bacterium]
MGTKNHDSIIHSACFRFYEELNDFLPKNKRKQSFLYRFKGNPSIKDAVEAIGVPHTEIDLILIDGVSVCFDYLIKGGESISVYPVFESFDIADINHLREEPLRHTKFVVDVNLGKLAHKLRFLGFDTLYDNDFADDEIVALSLEQQRIILTRDKGILKNSKVTHGYWVRSDDPKQQVVEVVKRLQLEEGFKPFTRCSVCNGELALVEKEEVAKLLHPDTFKNHDEFLQCQRCGKVYWKGSHYDRILDWIRGLT